MQTILNTTPDREITISLARIDLGRDGSAKSWGFMKPATFRAWPDFPERIGERNGLTKIESALMQFLERDPS